MRDCPPSANFLLQCAVNPEANAMPNKVSRIERRLIRLEKELAELKSEIRRQQVPWWKQIAGTFKDDPVYDEICRLGAAIRKEDRKGRI